MMQYRVDTARCVIKGDKPILDTQQDVLQTSVCDVTEFCYGTRWAEIPTATARKADESLMFSNFRVKADCCALTQKCVLVLFVGLAIDRQSYLSPK
jgi:hypothetical protein